MSYHYLMKFIIIGDTGVGKSCLSVQYSENRFVHSHDITIGVEFNSKRIILTDENNKDNIIKIQIWDTAGQEQFISITRSYYRGSAGVLVVFDITRRETFLNIKNWFREIDKNADDGCKILLIGNKSDLKERRQVSFEEANKLAKEYDVSYVETSAKNYENVEFIFNKLAKEILHSLKNENNSLQPGVRLGIVSNSKRYKSKGKKCCAIL